MTVKPGDFFDGDAGVKDAAVGFRRAGLPPIESGANAAATVKQYENISTVNSAFNETGGTWLIITLLAKFAI